jgi:CubicO group peptidase (beta-lactamase class C family)
MPQSAELVAARQLKAWLDAYNTGNIEVLRRFVAESFDKQRLKAGANPVSFFFVPVYPETRALLSVRTSPANPHEMLLQGLMRDTPPDEARRYCRLRDADIGREMTEFMNRLDKADAFSGTVLIAKGGRPLFRRAYGWANRERRERNQPETKFQLASLSKLFTGVAICQLAEQGRLSFTDSVMKLLPDYPNKAVGEKVTIQHLLTDTSGMGDFLDKKDYQAAEARLKRPADFFPSFAPDPLAFEPGEDEQYSNAGYIVLGAIIEKVSGQSFFSSVREHIFKPAKMLSSGYNETDAEIAGLAIGYRSGGWNSEWVRLFWICLILWK